jgi:hypothetical protein
MPFSERDWQHLRRVQGVALERFCARVLDEAVAITEDGDCSAHERYRRLFRLARERDATLASAFDDLRRSTGLQRLSAMAGLGVLTGEELAGFALDVQDAARDLGQPLAPRGSASRRDRPS